MYIALAALELRLSACLGLSSALKKIYFFAFVLRQSHCVVLAVLELTM